MKHIIKAYVHQNVDAWTDAITYDIFPFDMSTTGCDRVLVGVQSVEVDVPDDFDGTASRIAVLEEMKRKLRLKLAEELSHLDERISKLTCLTNQASA
jgi:hypothetical protein